MFGFRPAFRQFLIERDPQEPLFDAMMEQDVIDVLQLPPEPVVRQIADDGGDERLQLGLVGEKWAAGGGSEHA